MILAGLIWFFGRRYLEEKRIYNECIASSRDLLVVNPDEEYRVRKERLSRVKNAALNLDKDALALANLNNSLGSGTEVNLGGFSMGHSVGQSVGTSVGSIGSPGMSQFKRRDETRSDTGFWKSIIVTVRWTHKKSIYLSQKAIREIQAVRAMNHDNLAVCIGACVDKDMALVLYEYCPRGTLQEFIEREDQKFDWTMRIAFLEDIIHGLLFLQSSFLSCHGRLTSECCHIDGRFGSVCRTTAPEQIQLADDKALKHTSELDVYAFGIILQEVILRSYPYSMYQTTLGYDLVCTYLRVNKLINGKPLRPFFPPTLAAMSPRADGVGRQMLGRKPGRPPEAVSRRFRGAEEEWDSERARDLSAGSQPAVQDKRELRFHHRPNDPVKLQMGVHSGSCVAAVVGRLVPRYTLFGDTLDITKRMLLTGTSERIQISPNTKDVLETFGSFRTEERGEVFVRGKGALTTHWLTGEDGNKELKMLQNKYEATLFLDRDDF
ncbi:putative Atrial natriuretic peptide receptor 2 [Hypsibius exemplaris]|uniref:guanylate cyclase n=1 Tax=Hypsibius exemplaris TaxID=2072580 RepID=A0A9X6RLZ4_HYPEX|nr:putative Atrial natriuretic peptide receptor 2 [Hypsibius exemplaris]